VSLLNASTFLERIENDPDLKTQVTSSAEAVQLGKQLNLEFTEAELREAMDERYSELSPEQLEKMGGGFSLR
jgi:predicted ribosomally synthesized peptide with nif11-like leader